MEAEAILAFGYDLGPGHGHRLKLQEVDGWGHLRNVDWYSATSSDSLVRQATDHLLIAAGVEMPPVWGWDRQAGLKEHYGVWFKSYGDDDEPNYLLVAYTVTCTWADDAQPVDLDELAKQVVQHELDTKLQVALDTLGVTPKQERPAWLLCVIAD